MERREGGGAARRTHGAPPLPPRPTASEFMRRKRGSTGTPCEGVPRASDVGARALAALHRGGHDLDGSGRVIAAAPRSAFGALEGALGEPGWVGV
jgi:hypothetical protein